MPQPTRLSQSHATQPFPDPIPTVIPFGTVNFLAGSSGAGKSRMLTAWWDRWQRGATINGYRTNCPTALYWLYADRTWDEDGSLIFAGYDRTAPDVPHYNLASETIPGVKRHSAQALSLLRSCIDKLDPIPGSLLIIDPAPPLFIAGSINDARAVAWSLMDYRRIAQERLITLICTAYNVKRRNGEDQYTRPIDRLAGSGAFAGYAHTMMWMEEPIPERLHYSFGWRPRHAPEQEWAFDMDDQGRFIPHQGLQDSSPLLANDRPTQLLLLIPEEGIETSDLLQAAMELLKASRATVFRDLRKLESQQRVDTSTHGWVYRRKAS